MTILNRPYFYGYGMDKKVHAYTREEWGLGGALPSGGNYTTRSTIGMSLASAFMIPATLVSLLVFLVSAFSLKWYAIPALLFTLLFGAGALLGLSSVRGEMKARKLRKLKGLPKPWQSVTDDQAYEWFLQNPEAHVPLDLNHFPDSTRLQYKARLSE